jgi:peptidoglycan/LPS O-acetylase OafA/YrhL
VVDFSHFLDDRCRGAALPAFPARVSFGSTLFIRQILLLLAGIELSLHAMSALFFERPNHYPPALLWGSPFFYWFSWSIGAAIAEAYLERKPLRFLRIHPIVWLVPAILTSSFQGHEFSFSFYELCSASVIARSLSCGSSQEKKSYIGRFIRRTGLYSYSIYLTHKPILRAVGYLPNLPSLVEKRPVLFFVVALGSWFLTFPVSALVDYWVEKSGVALGIRVLRA